MFFLVPIYINHCLDWKWLSGWLESWEGLLFVTDVSTTCVEADCQNVSHKQQSFSGLQSPRWYLSIKVCYFRVQPSFLSIIAFDRTHTIYVVFQSRGIYDVPRVLIANARSFQALATILDRLTHLVSISCWYRSNARQHECRLKLHHCEFQNYEVITMSVVGDETKKHKSQLQSNKAILNTLF